MTQTYFEADAAAPVSTLQIRSARLADVAAELAQPTLRVEQLGSGRPLPAEVEANWADLQALTAAAVAAGQAVTTEPVVSHYVTVVMGELSYWWHDLSHQAASANQFRVGLTDEVAAVLGVPLTAGLVRRPFTGLVPDAHPYWGWATYQELVDAMAAIGPVSTQQRESHTVETRAFIACAGSAVERGTDLITIYDG